MPTIKVARLPSDALLKAYADRNTYTDCYSVKFARSVDLSDFLRAFYTSSVFKVERWLIARFLGLPAGDEDARALAYNQTSAFSAWTVEARASNQAILAAGQTRSWFMVAAATPESKGSTTLFFGSAVVPRKSGGFGWQFHALLGFHKVYSRVLLASAVRRLAVTHPPP